MLIYYKNKKNIEIRIFLSGYRLYKYLILLIAVALLLILISFFIKERFGINLNLKANNLLYKNRSRTFSNNEKIILAVQHPVTTEYKVAKKNMNEVISALLQLNEQTVYIYSNSDAGYNKMMQQILKRARKNKKIKLFKNLNHILYLSTMKNADVMVGNSSSGLIEAPSLQTPYVLIGTRQS